MNTRDTAEPAVHAPEAEAVASGATTASWWRRPGPADFLACLRGAALETDGGVAIADLPDMRPQGALDALAAELEAETPHAVARVDAYRATRGGPVHELALAAGAPAGSVTTVPQLLGEPETADSIFVVHGIREAAWTSWAPFLRTFTRERARRARPEAPRIIVLAARDAPPERIAPADVPVLAWRGVVGRSDMAEQIREVHGPAGDGLLDRVARATTLEIAAWDRHLAETLALLPARRQADPDDDLSRLAPALPLTTPCWRSGLVDTLDGEPTTHALALARAGDWEAIDRRRWIAQSSILFPFIAHVRARFVHHHRGFLEARTPHDKYRAGTFERTVHDPGALELYDLRVLLRNRIGEVAFAFLKSLNRIRTCMAHLDPVDADRLAELDEAWAIVREDLDDPNRGWDWPRLGQTLTLLVGPTGAGKSTHAAARFRLEEVVSSDAVRAELLGSERADGDQAAVFAEVRRRAVARLERGLSAVIDATHLRPGDRRATAELVPPDIPVRYVVLDRPLPDKLTAAEAKGIPSSVVHDHESRFAESLSDILAGDGLANVHVDERRSADTDEHAA